MTQLRVVEISEVHMRWHCLGWEESLYSISDMQDKLYFTYIVASRSLTLYVGMTGNLRKRIFEHKLKLREGFSSTYNCERLVWFEQFVEVYEAISREKQLKGWTRAKKIELIKKANPTWLDLSEEWYSPEQLRLDQS